MGVSGRARGKAEAQNNPRELSEAVGDPEGLLIMHSSLQFALLICHIIWKCIGHRGSERESEST